MESFIMSILAQLPTAWWDMGASMTRMTLAYLLSLLFAVLYGYFAATSRIAEKILIPILDILQSVPIMGFLPVAIVFFVDLTGPRSIIGPNLASVFLIFTSMSWNMAFGVYESLRAVPGDLREVSDSMNVHGWQRMKHLLLPSTANRLVYNSVLSWTNGWFFLVSAEIIATSTSIPLPGIGSYLLTAAATGNSAQIVTGIFVLVLVIALLNFLLWRPLSHWAEKYRYDTTPSGAAASVEVGGGERRASRVVGRAFVRGASVVSSMTRPFATIGTKTIDRFRGGPVSLEGHERRSQHRLARILARYLALGVLLIIAWLLVISLTVAVFDTYTSPIPASVMAYIKLIPEALAFSSARVFAAYLVSLAVAFPLALLFFRNARANRFGMPVVQIIASVPATALLPLFLFSLKDYIGVQAAVVFVMVTGTVWYLFFNVLSGLRNIPPDMEEAAKSLGLKGSTYYRRLVFPGIFSAFVTGSITAMGAAWNTLVIAEYLNYGNHSISTLGLGELIDKGVLPPPLGIAGGYPLMVTALLTLTITVVVVNRLIWKPLYRTATERYRYD